MTRQTSRPFSAPSNRSSDSEHIEELCSAFPVCNTLNLHPNEHLFLQGDRPKGVYKILSGTLIRYRVMADGRRQVQSFATEGDYVAVTAAEVHNYSAEALTNVVVAYVRRRTFDRLLHEDAKFQKQVFNLIGNTLQQAREQALLLGRKSAMERTATFLLFIEVRFRNPATGYTDIRMSRADIADYLGLTLETVSRMMNRLRKKGVISLPEPNRFVILQKQTLLQLAGETDTARQGGMAA
ncbi:MAG: helix-turn-helix domain-containing protein [Henriciella sp.]|nr:helix-turn-helix domain-containing protein [Henriciella sp.]